MQLVCNDGTIIKLESKNSVSLTFKIYRGDYKVYKTMTFKQLEAFIEVCNGYIKIDKETYIDQLKELGFKEL